MEASGLVSSPSKAQPVRESDGETFSTAQHNTRRIGLWAAALAALFAVIALGMGITTPARTGPFCQGGCLTYPYNDAAAFVPGDFYWMYPAIFMMLAFMALMACTYSVAQKEYEIFGRIGMSFALIATALITTDYFVQLSVVQPSLLKGETQGLALIGQYNPHGIFIALEDLGYLAMSLAFLCASPILSVRTRVERVTHWLFVLAPVLTIGSFIALSAIYGPDLDYRFEVLAITIEWITLIISGALLGIWFRRGEAREVMQWQ